MTEVVKVPTRLVTGITNVEGYLWSALDADDSGQMVEMAKFSDKCIHIYGTPNGGTLTLYGSNDPRALVDKAAGTLFGSATASWIALTDPQGNAIAKTAAAIEEVLENPLYYCVVSSGGGGSTAWTVALVGKKSV